jgi:hypothetical protein
MLKLNFGTGFHEGHRMSVPWAIELGNIRRTATKIRGPKSNGSFMMKSVLLGMLLFLGGIETVAADGADKTFQVFAMCIGGGILGMIGGISCYPPKDLRSLAQEIFGNLSMAIAFGPMATFWISDRCSAKPDAYWFVATSALLGICGLTIVKGLRSEVVSWIWSQFGFKPKSDEKTAP